MRRFRLSILLTLVLLVAPAAARADGLTPGQVRAAYNLPARAPSARTVAVVVAYDSPTVADDLAAAARRFGLPGCSTAGAAPCLRKVNQRGGAAPLPQRDLTGRDWIVESALGTQTVHGLCPNCRILLVEADSSSKADLSAGVATAVRLGAREVATSFVPSENLGDAAYAASYDHPGVAITAAAGDSGFASEPAFPASLPGVVAVGGTHLDLKHGGYGSERAWADGGSGCSSVFSAPPWQAVAARSAGCGTGRAIADVAAVADPGLLVHIGALIDGHTGWFEAGGTSLSSPVLAAAFALAGGGGTHPAEALHRRAADSLLLHDITRGANGSCASRAICAARKGYDGSTGVGTPRGVGVLGAGVPRLDRHRPGVATGAKNLAIDRTGRLTIRLTNANAFAVRARVALRAGDATARSTVELAPSGSRRLVLRIPRSALARMRRGGRTHASLVVALTGPGSSRARISATKLLLVR